MIFVTLFWNSSRSSKSAPRALRSTSLKKICNISSALTAKSESLHTHLRASPQRTAAQESRSPVTEPPQKSSVQMSSAFWSCPAFTLTKFKKVEMVTSPCRQDSLQKFLRDRDGTFAFDNCQQIWFEFLRTRVDEVRRTRTGNHTSSTL